MSAALFHDVMGEPHAPLKYMRFPWGLGESSTINKSWRGVWLLRVGLLVAAGAAAGEARGALGAAVLRADREGAHHRRELLGLLQPQRMQLVELLATLKGLQVRED